MEFGRVSKVLLKRWWIIVAAAIVGGLLGMYVANFYNNSIEPSWKAEAPLSFLEASAATDPAAPPTTNVDIAAEQARAQLILEDTLLADPSLSVGADTDKIQLLFTATGTDGDETLAAAMALRNEYRQTGGTALSPALIDAAMANLLVEIDRIDAAIEDLTPAETVLEDPSLTTRRGVLQTQIDDLNRRQAQVQIWITNPELRPTVQEFNTTKPGTIIDPVVDPESTDVFTTVSIEELQAEATSNDIVLARLDDDIARLPAPPEATVLDTESTLALDALQLDRTNLQNQYIALLRLRDPNATDEFAIEPIVTDETAAQVPPSIASAIGFILFAVVASIALVSIDSSRERIWSPSELGRVVSLGAINRNREGADPSTPWFPTALSERRRDVQTLRAGIDAITEERPAVVGLYGVDVGGDEVGELAGDLAMAFAVAERRVLLIDANAFQPNLLPEFGEDPALLTDFLAQDMTPKDAHRSITALFSSIGTGVPGLDAVRINEGQRDPIDALASPNYRLLIDEARSHYDIVIVAGPPLSEPLSGAAVRGIDHVVLLAMEGRTTRPLLGTAAAALEDRRITVSGVVLLHGRRQRVWTTIRRVAHGSVPTWSSTPTRAAATTVSKLRGIPHEVYTEPEGPGPATLETPIEDSPVHGERHDEGQPSHDDDASVLAVDLVDSRAED